MTYTAISVPHVRIIEPGDRRFETHLFIKKIVHELFMM